jgi:hypothetical protein
MRVPNSMRRFVLICLPLFSLSVLAAGCGSEGTVSGKVYYKGQPVTGGTVHFIPQGKSGNYTSVIGTDGSYSISRLPVGNAKISVTGMTGERKGVPATMFKGLAGKKIAKAFKKMESAEKSESSGGAKLGGGKPGNATIPVPEKYGDPDESGLEVKVTGGNQPFDIKIE